MNFHVSRYSPNGQCGCLTVQLGKLIVTPGYARGLFGLDIVWGDKMVFSTDEKI